MFAISTGFWRLATGMIHRCGDLFCLTQSARSKERLARVPYVLRPLRNPTRRHNLRTHISRRFYTFCLRWCTGVAVRTITQPRTGQRYRNVDRWYLSGDRDCLRAFRSTDGRPTDVEIWCTVLNAGGLLCLVGVLGPVTGLMYLQNISVSGYAVAFPIASGMIARLFLRSSLSVYTTS
jgi:hypothetical protein